MSVITAPKNKIQSNNPTTISNPNELKMTSYFSPSKRVRQHIDREINERGHSYRGARWNFKENIDLPN